MADNLIKVFAADDFNPEKCKLYAEISLRNIKFPNFLINYIA